MVIFFGSTLNKNILTSLGTLHILINKISTLPFDNLKDKKTATKQGIIVYHSSLLLKQISSG